MVERLGGYSKDRAGVILRQIVKGGIFDHSSIVYLKLVKKNCKTRPGILLAYFFLSLLQLCLRNFTLWYLFCNLPVVQQSKFEVVNPQLKPAAEHVSCVTEL